MALSDGSSIVVMDTLRDTAIEIADEVVDAFSALHPHIRMNRKEWADLREMIEREVIGRFDDCEHPMRALDLLS
jgi:hypothetical protein